MLVINTGMVIAMIHMFYYYANKSGKELYDSEVKLIHSSSDEAVTQINYTIESGNLLSQKYTEYIEEEHLSEEETVKYLSHWTDYYDEITIVDRKSLDGIILSQNYDGKVDYVEQSFENVPGVKWLCENYEMLVTSYNKVQATDIIISETSGEYCYAYCQLVLMDGREKLLYFVNPVKNLENAVDTVIKEKNVKGLMIDSAGTVIFSNIQQNTIKVNDNVYEVFKDTCNEAECEDIEEALKKDKGNFIFHEKNGNEWVCFFGTVEGEKNWKYLCIENNISLNRKDKVLTSSIQVFIVMFFWLLADITGYFIYNRMLIKTLIKVDEKNKDLEAANKAKNMFISNMSHEIRTPINAVLGMDEMILRETDNEQIKEYAYNINNAGKVLLGIINDVLDYSKIESGKLEIIPDEYDLGSVVNDLCNIIYLKTKEKSLKLVLDVNPDTPHLLYGDEIRIKQIILNLLTNAVKYTEKGTVTFSVDFEEAKEETINLIVSVKDTGIGIKAEEMDKLCSAFERLDERRNRSIEGTGLGMSIVTRLINQMDGNLNVESEYGVGSCFKVTLEQKVIDRTPVGNINDMKLRIHENTDENQLILRASKAKILAVDDTLVNLTVVKGLLKRTGIQVDTAESGQECLEIIKKNSYDLILLDHRMPGMDGIETLAHIKEMGEEYNKIPVIALTANVVSGAYDMYIKAGFTDFLSKPISGNKLERMVLKYLPKELLDSEEDIAAQINTDSGLEACGSKEVYDQVLDEFVTVYQKNKQEILDYFNEKDINNYTIKVHALKSSARLVGAEYLSNEALELENCGNEGKWDIIEEKNATLINHYDLVVSSIKVMLGKLDNDDGKELVDETWLKEALSTINELNEAFDFDSIDSIMQSITKYKLPQDKKEVIEKLKVAVYEFDQEEIRKILTNV